MRIGWKQIPNILSASRVLGALAFLLIYSNTSTGLFVAAVVIAALAIVTDFLDGYLARRWAVTSEFGYFLDGLGDKTFYFAVLIVMIHEGVSEAVLAWLLITREVILYALRALDANRAENLRRLRSLSRYHALFIRLYFLGFLVADGLRLFGYPAPAGLQYADIFGVVAAVLGFTTIVLQAKTIVRES